ncbi:signal transduction histidine kinase [Catenulispora sp. GAS73]|uniref:sensor histidine kinase n=1 Tax=Catenulispora sp. GAS73 TaxID=3156269 RepID=UPI0035142A7A
MRTQPPVPGQRAWVVFDVVSATAVTTLIAVQSVLNWHRQDWSRYGYPAPTAVQVTVVLAGVVVCGAALAARRWRPLLSAAAALAAWVVMLAVAWPLATLSLSSFGLVSTLLLYSVAVTEPLPVTLVTLAVLYAADTATVAASHHKGINLGATGLTLVLACCLGVGVARYRDIGARLREQQDAAARAELDRERVRLARELHDVLAHSMSVVNVQAGYGRFAIGRDPAVAEAALAAIQEVSREAMVEMRGMLTVLRDGGEAAALAPAPRLADVPRLVATCAEAGVTVRVRTRGQVRELPDGLELAAFRIVQEALTNVVKHAHTRSARVLLEYQDTALVVEVTDAGRGGPAPAVGGGGSGGGAPGTTSAVAGGGGGGHGLAGIAERVGLYEGTVEAGPLTGGGWRVRAVLPCSTAAPSSETAASASASSATNEPAWAAS